MTRDWVVQRTGKYCSIRRMEYPEFQTGIFGRMDYFFACRALHHPYPRVFCTLPSFARVKRPIWRLVGLNDRLLRSHGKIGDCEQSML